VPIWVFGYVDLCRLEVEGRAILMQHKRFQRSASYDVSDHSIVGCRVELGLRKFVNFINERFATPGQLVR